MISYILIILASICNAIMDVISFHYDDSIFNKLNPKYWNPQISWKNKYIDWDNGNKERKKFLGVNIAPAFTDAWHFFKSLMIVLMVLAIVLYKPLFGQIIDFFVIGLIWNLCFSFFYNVIFKKI